MPSRAADETSQRPPIRRSASYGFSAIEHTCIEHLIGHTLARVECEFILETLRHNQGNRTRAANVLGISIRSLRDRIRDYRSRGEDVPEPGSSLSGCPTGRSVPDSRH